MLSDDCTIKILHFAKFKNKMERVINAACILSCLIDGSSHFMASLIGFVCLFFSVGTEFRVFKCFYIYYLTLSLCVCVCGGGGRA